MTEEQRRAMEMLSAGEKVADIATAVGKSVSTIRRWAKSLAEKIVDQQVYASVVADLPGQQRLKATYTNAARAGRTQPGKIEMIEADDPRHRFHPNPKGYAPNRAEMRRRGFHGRNGGPRQYPDGRGGTKLAGALRVSADYAK